MVGYQEKLSNLAESFKHMNYNFQTPEEDNSESDRHAKATSLNIARMVLNEEPNESGGFESQHNSCESKK